MAQFLVTSSGAPGSTGLTFEAAVQAAASSPDADTIRFATDVVEVTLDEAITISGELIIDGDHNGDGISDVVLVAENNRHLDIAATAEVTIRNIDFVGGYDAPKTYEGIERLPASGGMGGAEGTLTPGSYPLDGADGNDDAGNGTRGSDGLDGIDAAGSILNAGSLTLERVGFGGNFARGEIGQRGGTGGPGGSSRAEQGDTDHVSGLESTGFGLDEDWRQYLLSGALEGGEGGDGGRGGFGGNGGDGGDGGDAAAAILNEGSLTLVDTVFAGRLTSGVLGGGNNAYGGHAGAGGGGGYGGSSWGGDGGNSGRQWFNENDVAYRYVWDYNYEEHDRSPNVQQVGPGEAAATFIIVHTEETSAAGAGGDGGIPGQGGTGGRGGTSGDAATIINRGSITGTAALANNPDGESFHNIAEVRDPGRAGFAGAGGGSYGGDGGTELGPFKSISFPSELDLANYRRTGTEPDEWVTDVWANFTASTGYAFGDLPKAGGGPEYTVEGSAADGVSLPRASSGATGQPGLTGTATTGVGGSGSAGVRTNTTLVYLHDLGQDDTTGQLAFNIIRVGDLIAPVEVSWQLVGNGANPLSAADFAPGTSLSGTVNFAALTAADDVSREADAANNVRRVVLDIAADAIAEVPEGYRFELTSVSGSAVRGTHEATGTAVDTMLGGGGTLPDPDPADPIEGGSGPDVLDGTDGDDEIRAGAGADTVKPGKGDDTVSLGRGRDTVEGALADFFGDTITDFSDRDTLLFRDSHILREAITVTTGSAILAIDGDGDGTSDGSFVLEGDFSGGDFMAVIGGADTTVTFETFLPSLSDGAMVDDAAVNGINNQPFLTGNGATDFLVTLRDMGYASYNNVLGVYEIDAAGQIVDTQILFGNVNADKTAMARITDVEAGNRLGFFLVQDAADWAAGLSDGDMLGFVDGAGNAATLADGSDLFLAVNGTAVDETVFHSFAAAMNGDGLQHALSGVEEGGEAISVGFEDLTGGGDRDFEDVVFRIEQTDPLV